MRKTKLNITIIYFNQQVFGCMIPLMFKVSKFEVSDYSAYKSPVVSFSYVASSFSSIFIKPPYNRLLFDFNIKYNDRKCLKQQWVATSINGQPKDMICRRFINSTSFSVIQLDVFLDSASVCFQ